MLQRLIRRFTLLLSLTALLGLSGCGYNDFQRLDEETKAAWAEVLKKNDQIGVVIFDEAADWIVELQPAGNRDGKGPPGPPPPLGVVSTASRSGVCRLGG